MSGQSSQIVERLWRLKRGIEHGQCQGLSFAHLNNLLRDPAYRQEVLDKVIQNGTESMRKLALEIQSLDSGEPLMAASKPARRQVEDPDEPQVSDQPRGGIRHSALWLVPVLGLVLTVAVGFTVLGDDTVRVSEDITTPTTWEAGNTYILKEVVQVRGTALTIEAGARIEGTARSALIVGRDAKLAARGTASEPVVFTSHNPTGKPSLSA